jgi:hypothetical protein
MRCEPQYFRPRNHWPPSKQSNDCNKQLWTSKFWVRVLIMWMTRGNIH